MYGFSGDHKIYSYGEKIRVSKASGVGGATILARLSKKPLR